MNLREVDVVDVAVVTGHAAHQIAAVAPRLERQLGVRLTLLANERATVWNNAYSLWLARDAFNDGALLVNGDTVHPASVERRLLETPSAPAVLIAVDDVKALGQEEMKVTYADDGHLARIHKDIPPDQAKGEYIGVTRIKPAAAETLGKALEATWGRDPALYYEDGFQQYVDWGEPIGVALIGQVDWVEVDDHRDLERARTVICRS
jgi:choline kinase